MGTMTTAPRMAKMPTFNRLYTVSELAAMTTRQRNQYERSLKQHRDMLADKETTKIRMQREREEGMLEGMEKGIAETARKFKKLGVDISTIVAATGLSADEIEKL